VVATAAPTVTLEVTATWSDLAECQSPIGSDRIETLLPDSAGGWLRLPGYPLTAPAGALSVDLSFQVTVASGEGYVVHLDHLSLLADLLFADGFDGGDPSAWALVAP
jgi:hypothetical protein